MHLRGKAAQIRAIHPSGESQLLLSVPKYDFNWQLTYALVEPVLLEKGTELEVVGWFDNSPNNPWNPNPAAEVFFGEQTWEEMLVGFFDLAIPVSLAPERIFSPASATPQPASSGGQ
jgi:hypothetical protein